MDWRIVVAGFVVSVGFVVGWMEFGTLGGAVLSVVFVSGLFLADWAIDEYIYEV
ncbi:hypothetical protein [Halorussus halobius]|uniref:hypothetical protein n=1 Tax=Halorussus halobius TaxID=1710537 RepID=UPI00143CE422|nr:hypothetical protein [Halorussus halobius]